MQVLFLVNPKAGGRGRVRTVDTALARFNEAGWQVITVRTRSMDHAAEEIVTAQDQGYDLLVIGGGDGSIHHLVQHLPIGTPDKPAGIPFGIVPLGSGNDFYRGVGAPMDPGAAADNIVNGSPVPIDIGLVEQINDDGSPRGARPIRFTNTAGIGIDSQTLALRERAPSWLSARYELLFLTTLIWMKPLRLTLEADSWSRELDGYWVLCCNNGTIGTGMKIAPEASFTDGLMDVVIVEKIPKMRFVVNLPKVFKGTHLNVKGFSVTKARSLIVRSTPDLRLAIDGDREFKPPARISILPGAVRLMTKNLGQR
jgi:diacylglycerol kinase (ATP)